MPDFAAEDCSARLPQPPPPRCQKTPIDHARLLARSIARPARHLATIALAIAFVVAPGLADASVPPTPRVAFVTPLSSIQRDEVRSRSAQAATITASASIDRTPLRGSACDAGDTRVIAEPGGRRLDRDDAATLAFESRTDPRQDRHAKISSVRVSGPLYPIQQKHGYDLRPNTELSVRALAEFFKPSSVGALVGKYVVIVPVH